MPGGSLPKHVYTQTFITTKNVSEIVAESYEEVEVWKLLDEESKAILRYICVLLSERAALMVAVPLANFLNRFVTNLLHVISYVRRHRTNHFI